MPTIYYTEEEVEQIKQDLRDSLEHKENLKSHEQKEAIFYYMLQYNGWFDLKPRELAKEFKKFRKKMSRKLHPELYKKIYEIPT